MLKGELKNNDILPCCLQLVNDVPFFVDSYKSLQNEESFASFEDEIDFIDGRTIRRFTTQILDKSNKYIGRLYIYEDITERRRMEDELSRAKQEAEKAREQALNLAYTDYLTGLLNRRAFMDRLQNEQSRAAREGASLSIILADIDHFKKINDTYGHLIGDTVLQKFTGCLTRSCRPYDFIGRFGGEEFIICLPETTIQQAFSISERMRVAVEQMPIDLPGNFPIYITASFGVSSVYNEMNIDVYISFADEALYAAKANGRNKVVLSSK